MISYPKTMKKQVGKISKKRAPKKKKMKRPGPKLPPLHEGFPGAFVNAETMRAMGRAVPAEAKDGQRFCNRVGCDFYFSTSYRDHGLQHHLTHKLADTLAYISHHTEEEVELSIIPQTDAGGIMSSEPGGKRPAPGGANGPPQKSKKNYINFFFLHSIL